VHTDPGSRSGLEVKRVLCDEERTDPRWVVLGHSGDTTDCDHLAELADAGFVLGMDRFGFYRGTTFEARADTLVEMCRRGYLHIHDEVLPYVREHGVTEAQIATMLIANPRRLFETGAVDRNKAFSGGAVTRTDGYVQGTYLFRAVQQQASA
jgi:phosphotriesterase-related protein